MTPREELEALSEAVLEQAAQLEATRRNIRSILRNSNRLKDEERIQLARAAEGAHASTLQCFRVYHGVLDTMDILTRVTARLAEEASNATPDTI